MIFLRNGQGGEIIIILWEECFPNSDKGGGGRGGNHIFDWKRKAMEGGGELSLL